MASLRKEHLGQLSISHSYFKYSFSNIIYSVNLQSFNFQYVKFLNTLSTAIVIVADGTCKYGSNKEAINTPVENYTIKWADLDKGDYERALFNGDCGDITFRNCIFERCKGKDTGGGIYCYVAKEQKTTLEACLFDHCLIWGTATGSEKGGGAALINCPTTNITYTCCQNCGPEQADKLSGTSMVIFTKNLDFAQNGAFINKGKDNNTRSDGAQFVFDRYTANGFSINSVSCKNVNISDGASKYNGGLEFVYPPLSSIFRFITITEISSSYLFVFKNSHIGNKENYELYGLNFFYNKLSNSDKDGLSSIFFFLRDDGSLEHGQIVLQISNMNIYGNSFTNGRIFVNAAKNENSVMVDMSNCIFDKEYKDEFDSQDDSFSYSTKDCSIFGENQSPTFITFNWEKGICHALFVDESEEGDSSNSDNIEDSDSSNSDNIEDSDSRNSDNIEDSDSSNSDNIEDSDSSNSDNNKSSDNNSDPTDNEKPPDTDPGPPIGGEGGNKNNGLPTGAIIGIIIACLVVLAVVIVLIVFAMKRNRAQSSQNLEPGENEMEEIPSDKSFESNTDPAIGEKLHSNKQAPDDPFDEDFHEVVEFFN